MVQPTPLSKHALSYNEKIVLAYSRTVSGTLSLIACSIIINKIMMSYNKKRRDKENGTTDVAPSTTIYQRLLFGMSVLDILHSFWAALSTLPVPASSGAVFGHGNTATCSAQGFFVQFSAASPVYIASLTTYFMLKIRYNVSDEVLSKRYEFWFHAIPVTVAVGGGSIGAALKIFNPIALPELGCWVAPFPRGCHITGGCTRGYKIGQFSDYYAWALAFSWFFLSFLVVLVTNVIIYSFIRRQERRRVVYLASRVQTATEIAESVAATDPISSKDLSSEAVDSSASQVIPLPVDEYDDDDDDSQNLDSMNNAELSNASNGSQRSIKTSRIAAVQCLLYVSTALFTAIWSVMPWIGKKLGVATEWRFFFAFMFNIFNPLQGFCNLIIFIRLQYLRLRVTEPDWTRFQCIKFCLFSPDTK